jgi:hypothetical protein
MNSAAAAREFTAVIADVRLQHSTGTRQVWQMSLDRTGFAPGDTGALMAETRSGTRLEIPVTEVLCDADGVIWHVAEKPLAAGTDVRGKILSTAL